MLTVIRNIQEQIFAKLSLIKFYLLDISMEIFYSGKINRLKNKLKHTKDQYIVWNKEK